MGRWRRHVLHVSQTRALNDDALPGHSTMDEAADGAMDRDMSGVTNEIKNGTI